MTNGEYVSIIVKEGWKCCLLKVMSNIENCPWSFQPWKIKSKSRDSGSRLRLTPDILMSSRMSIQYDWILRQDQTQGVKVPSLIYISDTQVTFEDSFVPFTRAHVFTGNHFKLKVWHSYKHSFCLILNRLAINMFY